MLFRSGNDFARGLGYPRTRKKLARFLAQARARRIDVGVANGRAFLNASGVGIDGHVAERVVASSRVIGQTLGYFVGALVSIATYEPRAMRVRVGATLREGRHLVVVAANGMYFGNGMRVAPDAKLDDGLLDVIVAGDLGKWESLVALAKIYRGTHVDGRRIVAFRTPAVEIELADELPMQLDGEAMRTRRLDIGLRPRALTVLGR